MKKILTILLSALILTSFTAAAGAQQRIIPNNYWQQTSRDQNSKGDLSKRLMKSKFTRFDTNELNTLLNKNFSFAKRKNILAPYMDVIGQISPNNFLLGEQDYSKKLLTSFEKMMPDVPDLLDGITEEMSSLDVLVQVAKNMSHEKVFQDSGMDPIEDSDPDLAAYAPVFEAVRQAEKSKTVDPAVMEQLMNLKR